MFRQLPPTATPLHWSHVAGTLSSPVDAVDRLRVALTAQFGVQSCQVAASGRSALYLLLKQLAAKRDHEARCEVVLPAYTCPSLAKVILDLGLWPRLVDLSPQNFMFERGALEAVVGLRTLAVICVHPFGIPQSIQYERRLAHAAGAVLIEDAAQSMGARIDGRPVGVQGDFGLFSLGPGKPISVGGGGIVCANDADAARLLNDAWQGLPAPSASAEWLARLRLAAFSAAFQPAGWWLATRAGAHRVGDNESSWGYRIVGLTDFQAGLAQAYLGDLDAINAARRGVAEQMLPTLRAMPGLVVPEPVNTPVRQPVAAEAAASGDDKSVAMQAVPIYLRLPILAADESHQARLFQALWSAGIGVGRVYKRTLADFFPQLAGGEFSGAQRIADCLLTLPTHHHVSAEDVAHILEIVEANPP